ncbi:MAG: hypothetical protein R3323_02015 [Wenzhouxiangellaceae bacterium]|nr:hypothetical protein [Wenzhouxiangellaceae bacterium]
MKRVLAFMLIVTALAPCAAARAEAPADRVARQVAFEPEPGTRVPLDTLVATLAGPRRLGDLSGGRPILLHVAWYACRNLCGLTLNGLADRVSDTRLRPGVDFDVVVLGLDPEETPGDAQRRGLELAAQYPDADIAEGWHFVTASGEAIETVTGSIGYRYAWDERGRQYAHPAGIVAVDAAGTITDFLAGVNFATDDIDSLVATTIGGERPVRPNPVLLICYDYDPATGQYSFAIMKAVRAGGLLVLLVLGGFLWRSLTRERRDHA